MGEAMKPMKKALVSPSHPIRGEESEEGSNPLDSSSDGELKRDQGGKESIQPTLMILKLTSLSLKQVRPE